LAEKHSTRTPSTASSSRTDGDWLKGGLRLEIDSSCLYSTGRKSFVQVLKMFCLSSLESARDCVHAAIPLLQLVTGLVGLGTFAFIAVLHWTIRNLNTQLRSWEERVVTAEREASQANEGKRLAGEAKVGYEALALDRAAQIKELQAQALSLEKSLRLGEDETKREVAALSNRLARLQGKIGSALRATEYAGIATIEQIAGFW
jgi:hypothetical protein